MLVPLEAQLSLVELTFAQVLHNWTFSDHLTRDEILAWWGGAGPGPCSTRAAPAAQWVLLGGLMSAQLLKGEVTSPFGTSVIRLLWAERLWCPQLVGDSHTRSRLALFFARLPFVRLTFVQLSFVHLSLLQLRVSFGQLTFVQLSSAHLSLFQLRMRRERCCPEHNLPRRERENCAL